MRQSKSSPSTFLLNTTLRMFWWFSFYICCSSSSWKGFIFVDFGTFNANWENNKHQLIYQWLWINTYVCRPNFDFEHYTLTCCWKLWLYHALLDVSKLWFFKRLEVGYDHSLSYPFVHRAFYVDDYRHVTWTICLRFLLLVSWAILCWRATLSLAIRVLRLFLQGLRGCHMIWLLCLSWHICRGFICLLLLRGFTS